MYFKTTPFPKKQTKNKSLTLSSVGDGRLGFPDGAPYDAIHVGAAAPTVPKAVRAITGWCNSI